jgi:hypothetical protein
MAKRCLVKDEEGEGFPSFTRHLFANLILPDLVVHPPIFVMTSHQAGLMGDC